MNGKRIREALDLLPSHRPEDALGPDGEDHEEDEIGGDVLESRRQIGAGHELDDALEGFGAAQLQQMTAVEGLQRGPQVNREAAGVVLKR